MRSASLAVGRGEAGLDDARAVRVNAGVGRGFYPFGSLYPSRREPGFRSR